MLSYACYNGGFDVVEKISGYTFMKSSFVRLV
jgi:hypothetical protein